MRSVGFTLGGHTLHGHALPGQVGRSHAPDSADPTRPALGGAAQGTAKLALQHTPRG